MKDRAWFRFDTVIAVCALLASSIASVAMVYQTRVLQDQFVATIWPYLSVDVDNASNSVVIRLTNDGVGPALIRSASLAIDDRPSASWRDVFRMLSRDPALKGAGRISGSTSSIDASTAIRAAQSRQLFSLQAKNPRVITAAAKHRVVLHVCYCSINERCWRIDQLIGAKTLNPPQSIKACTENRGIEA